MFSLINGTQSQYKYSNIMKNKSYKEEVTYERGRVKEGN
jgi:hypothetical protein